jgi:hypothetical protein
MPASQRPSRASAPAGASVTRKTIPASRDALAESPDEDVLLLDGLDDDASDSDSDSSSSSSDGSSDGPASPRAGSGAGKGALPAQDAAARLRAAALAVAARVAVIPSFPTAGTSSSSAAAASAPAPEAGAALKKSRQALTEIAQASFATHVAGIRAPSPSGEGEEGGGGAAGGARGTKRGRGHLATGDDGAQGLPGLLTDPSHAAPSMLSYASSKGVGSGVRTAAAARLDASSSAAASAAPVPVDAAVQAALSKAVQVDASRASAPGLAPKEKRARGESSSSATAGKRWFDMAAPEVTAEVKRDLLILKNRAYLDPKRHYKTREERVHGLPKHFQIGTVVEAPNEGHSRATRLTNKERKPTLVAALLADDAFQRYAARTVSAVEERGRQARVGNKGKDGGRGGRGGWGGRGRGGGRRFKR